MVEFHNLVKQIDEERSKLEKILASSITKLQKAGLNTDKFENNLFYYDSFNEKEGEEGENNYAYIQRMIRFHSIENIVEQNNDGYKIWSFEELKKLIEDWINSLSIKELLSDAEIDKEIEESVKYFGEVSKDYKLADTETNYFIAKFNDDIKLISKSGRQERREHGEHILNKDWMISSINIIAKLDFEEKISNLRGEGYFVEDNPIFGIYEKYKQICQEE